MTAVDATSPPVAPATSTGPSFGYTLDCAHEDAREALAAWLDGTQLSWPGSFTLRVTVGETDPFAPDARDTFYQPDVGIQGGAPSGVLRLTWTDTPAVAEIHEIRPEADLWLSPAAVANLPNGERGFLLTLLVFLLRRLGWFHVHGASMIDPRGRGWLIAGNSHCGKSTTTALMATRGWQITTDDIGFLARQGDRIIVHGSRSRIALRAGGLAMLGATGGEVLAKRGKEGFWPENLGGAWIPQVTPDIIAFPSIGDRTAMTRAVPRQALSEIVKWSHWVLYEPGFAQEHLDVLGALASQSRCFNLTLGPDLFERPHLLEDLAS